MRACACTPAVEQIYALLRVIRASQPERPLASRTTTRDVNDLRYSASPWNSSRQRQRILAVVTDMLNSDDNGVFLLARLDALQHRSRRGA
jgi:hypothetical protein